MMGVSILNGGVWLPLQEYFLEGAGSGAPVTHGRQIDASNTGLNFNLIDPNSLTPMPGYHEFTTPNQIIEGKLFDDRVDLNASGIIMRNCMFVGGGLNKFGIVVLADNITIEGVDIHAASGTSWYTGLFITDAADGTLINRCDISGGDNNSTNYGINTVYRQSYIHDADTLGDPTDHPDNIEVYGGSAEFDMCNLPMGVEKYDASINIAPYGGRSVTHVNIHDCVLDGGQAHIIASGGGDPVTNVKILRNDCGGHTNPDTDFSFGIYMLASYWTISGLCETQAEQDASGGVKILCPSSGADANYWRGCDDLVPNLTGQVAYPRS